MYFIVLHCIVLHCIVYKAKYHLKTGRSWQEIMEYLLYQIRKKRSRSRKKYINDNNINNKKIHKENQIQKQTERSTERNVHLRTAMPLIFISIIFKCIITFSNFSFN